MTRLTTIAVCALFVAFAAGCGQEPEGPAEQAGKAIDESVDQAKETMSEAAEQVEEASDESVDQAKETMSEAAEQVEEASDEAADKIEEAGDTLREKASE